MLLQIALNVLLQPFVERALLVILVVEQDIAHVAQSVVVIAHLVAQGDPGFG